MLVSKFFSLKFLAQNFSQEFLSTENFSLECSTKNRFFLKVFPGISEPKKLISESEYFRNLPNQESQDF